MATDAVSLVDRLDEALELRPFPTTASQLLVACDRNDVTAKELSDIIKLDSVLSLQLLRMANSPIYGFVSEIRSVDHAAVVLGMRALRDIAISTAVQSAFETGDSGGAQARQQLWLHSLACGTIAQALGEAIQMPEPTEAFVAGIIHDVGKLLFFDWKPAEYLAATGNRRTTGAESVSVETDAFGISHTSVGRSCGENWGLPDELNDVICFHHTPDEADFGGELIDVVSVANRLSHIWLAGEDSQEQVQQTLVERGLDLSEPEVATLKAVAFERLSEVQRNFA